MRKIVLSMFFIITSFLLVACNYIEEDKIGERISITHTVSKFHETGNDGEKVYMRQDITEEFLINPKRVVTFNLGVADIFSSFGLENLGIEKFGLPKTNLPKSLEVFNIKEVVNTGTLFEPDTNVLDLFNADLIILDGRSSDKYEQLKARYPKTDILDLSLSTYDFLTHQKNYDVISKIFPQTKERLDNEIILYEEAFNEISEISKDYVAMFVQLNGSNISVSTGSLGRYGLLYNEFGFKVPSFSEIENENTHGTMPASKEMFTEINPDIIFIMDRNLIVEGVTSDPIFNDPFYKNINAVKNNNVYNLDPTSWYTVTGGIKATNQMILDIKQFTNKNK